MMNVVGNEWCKVTNPWSLSSCHHLKPCRVDVWSFVFNYSFVLMGAHEYAHIFLSFSSIKNSLSLIRSSDNKDRKVKPIRTCRKQILILQIGKEVWAWLKSLKSRSYIHIYLIIFVCVWTLRAVDASKRRRKKKH
jgi:hypothetical protein